MRQASGTLLVTAPRQGLHLITDAVAGWVAGQGVGEGLLTLMIRHTSASLLIQENAAPAARRDLENWLARIAPESRDFEHDDEGPDDMPAHLRSVLTATTLSIPVQDGRMRLGTWQGIYLCEHRRQPSGREIAAHLLGA
ncbi:secondary thiamine-phosphate synthase enzyme YjbQ [Sphingomonas glaciei]|uniref:Secondary thiamine-phosphate synthase enzyme YjbQ n=1 Tax=Sphingomonas glaciei TaxID=2938948 RepID=A0ABY5MXY7_9SPHN|nr:secondary thiamine-phosphate synthase enzyme YjbQ [Sphingomonas glaciei]UUR08625.1 secondary thiamine-phosphate synthase enzyme YjbQ [Sphingomonas glaciei]